MDQYKVYYNNNNTFTPHKKYYSLPIFDLKDLHLQLKSFNSIVSMYIIDKDIIKQEEDSSLLLNMKSVYMYNQQDSSPYKRIIFNYIYNIDVFILLISKRPITNELIPPIQTMVHQMERRIKTLKPETVKEVDVHLLNDYDVSVFHSGPFIDKIKLNVTHMETLFSKISKVPKKIEVVYRGIKIPYFTDDIFFENKYVSTSIVPSTSFYFTGNRCCMQFLYNLDVPYIFINDYEQEYLLDKDFYYHLLETNHVMSSHTEDTIKCYHFLISKKHLSPEKLTSYKKDINIDKHLISMYEKSTISDYSYIPPVRDVDYTPIYISNHDHNHINHQRTRYKYMFKKITAEELDTLLLYKISASYTNDYLQFNIPLYYSLLKTMHSSKQVVKSNNIYISKNVKNINIPYYKQHDYDHYLNNGHSQNYFNHSSKYTMIIIPLIKNKVLITTDDKDKKMTKEEQEKLQKMNKLHINHLTVEKINNYLVLYHENGLLITRPYSKNPQKEYSIYPDFALTESKKFKHKQYTELHYGSEESIFSSMQYIENMK